MLDAARRAPTASFSPLPPSLPPSLCQVVPTAGGLEGAWAETAEERRHQVPQGLGLEGEWETAERAAVEVRDEREPGSVVGRVLEGGREEGWEGRGSNAHSFTHVKVFTHVGFVFPTAQGPDIGAAAGLEGAWAQADRARGGQGYVVERREREGGREGEGDGDGEARSISMMILITTNFSSECL